MSLRMLPAMKSTDAQFPLRAASMASFVVLAVPGSVLAHAELQRAIPADGETVTDPVRVVTGSYSQDLAANSTLLVKDASGATVATGSVDPGNVRRMIARPASPLGNGAYEVQRRRRSRPTTAISSGSSGRSRSRWQPRPRRPRWHRLPPNRRPSARTSARANPSGGEPSSASPPASASPAPSPTPAPALWASDSSNVLPRSIAALAIVAIGAGYLLNRNRGRSS